MEIHERARNVETKADLVAFVQALAQDLERNAESWENPSLERYLKALASWLEDSDGYYRNQGKPIATTPSWKNVADIAHRREDV